MMTKEVSVRRSDHELSKQLEISIKKKKTRQKPIFSTYEIIWM